MDPHYHIVPVQDGSSYDSVPPPSYEYTTTAAAPYNSRDDPYNHPASQSTGLPYGGGNTGLLSGGHQSAVVTGPPTSYPTYPSSAQAMEYVQSMYQMQIAQEMAVGFSENGPYANTRAIMTSEGRRKRRRIITHDQRKAANIRERRRMFHLNEAFDQLRKRVPTFAYEKKLSRIETLKLAVTYIQFMGDLVTELGGETTTLDLSGCSTTEMMGDESEEGEEGEEEDSPGGGTGRPRTKQEVCGVDSRTTSSEEGD